MSIRATCSGCGKTVKAGDDWSGKTGRCPGCGESITFVPQPPPALNVEPPAITIPPTPRRDASVVGEPPSTSHTLSRSRWALTVTAIVSLVVGYFLGREHIKYQLRSALLSFGQSVREAVDSFDAGRAAPATGSSSIGASQFQPPTEPESRAATHQPVKIVDINTRVTESNEIWHKHAWILELRNTTDSDVVAEAEITWLDSGGFVIESDREYGLYVPAGETKVFRGFELIQAGVSRNVDAVNASVRVR